MCALGVAQTHTSLIRLREKMSHTKICKNSTTFGIDKNILGFDISMNNAKTVKIGNC